MIEVEKLTKIYGSTRSLDGLTFSVERGQVLGLLGPNGAGKTTTMRILTGLSRPTSGVARVGGHDTAQEHLALRRKLGYLPEEAPLYGEMKAEQYLRFMAGVKLIDRHRIPAEVDRVLEETSLTHVRKRVIGNLSKGTRQRLGIAQALLGNPQILILDEPTVGLDPTQINEMRQLIASMKGIRTVVLSTHILHNVAMTCSHVVIINNGRLVAQGAVDEVGNALGSRKIYVGVRGDAARLKEILAKYGTNVTCEQIGAEAHASLVPNAENDGRAAMAREIMDAGMELFELHEERPTLEDVFLKATSEDNGAAA